MDSELLLVEALVAVVADSVQLLDLLGKRQLSAQQEDSEQHQAQQVIQREMFNICTIVFPMSVRCTECNLFIHAKFIT